MKKIAFAAIAALIATATAFAASPAATQDWVRRYVSTNGVSVATNMAEGVEGSISQVITNGEFFIRGYGYDGSNDWVEIRGEYPDRLALMATNVTEHGRAEGITNGMLFVHSGDGFFVNSPANVTIYATATNFMWRDIGSVHAAGLDEITWKREPPETDIVYFSLVGTKLTKSEAAALLPQDDRASSFAERIGRAFAFALSLLVPSANADTWNDFDFYKPIFNDPPPESYAFEVRDSKGVTAEIFISSEDGEVLNPEALSELKNTVNSVLNNVVGLACGLSDAFNAIHAFDMKLETMDIHLNSFFAEAWAKMNAIEEQVASPTDSGGTEPITIEKTIIEKTTEKIVVKEKPQLSVAALPVDGVSVGVSSRGGSKRYQVKGFDSQNRCEADLARMVVDKNYTLRRNHYFLAREGTGEGARMHYVQFTGDVYDEKSISPNSDHHLEILGYSYADAHKVPTKPQGEDAAIEWQFPVTAEGTEGSGEGYKVKFESEDDSNVKFKVSDDGNGVITVKVGVYYK